MRSRNGFTVVELMAVLAVLAVLSAVAVPSLTQYIHLSQFRRNEEYAKTIYLDAESALTYYRTGREWDEFRRLVMAEGTVSPVGEEDRPIYAICLGRGEYASAAGDAALVRRLLDPDTYDKGVLDAAICIEIDVNAGQVYSVFYTTSCDGLTFSGSGQGSGVWLDLSDEGYREYDARRAQRLGYYSAGNPANVVELELIRLRILSISLINSETLTLNWSSNSTHGDLDVAFDIALYDADGGAKLWSTVVDRYELGGADSVLDVAGGTGGGRYRFPLSYENGRFSLTLDAMMNAQLLDTLEANEAAVNFSSTSVTRLPGCEAPLNVYATIKVRPTYRAGIGGEYQESAEVTSNRANTMFGDGASGSSYQISAFRHLSNLRYIGDENAVFTVTGGALNWTSDNVVVYSAGNGSLTAAKGSETVFPTIPELKAGQTLTGGAPGALSQLASLLTGSTEPATAIANLRLGPDSVADGELYLGLIGENQGKIEHLKLTDPQVSVTGSTDLLGVGAFCGRSTGELSALALRGAAAPGDGKKNVEVVLTAAGSRMGVGGIAGILDGGGTAVGLSAEGTVSGHVPAPQDDTVGRGVAGLIGCAEIGVTGKSLKDCENRAAVTGNRCVGGVVGWLSDARNTGAAEGGNSLQTSVENCANQGLILVSAQDGRYAGGIVGYGLNAQLDGCVSGSGRAEGYEYDPNQRESLLLGDYVGGIVGYGQSSYLNNCRTEPGGYVLGGAYVGGIAGGLDGDKENKITASTGGNVSVTVNASYVIGNRCVGGIVGENRGESTIDNCINNGVAVGYERFIGGICGSNVSDGAGAAVIKNCASYLSDTDHRIAARIDSWGATGDCTGGLVGYNSGTILFHEDGNYVSNKSVSSIVVGKDYVGGLVGFNDAGGSIDVEYRLLGGHVSATGDCVGGLVGLNASPELLDQTLEIQPGDVKGRCFVGGAIGANVVALEEDASMNGIRVTNQLGTITGEAFCGGLLGYHGTVRSGQPVTLDTVESLLPRIMEGNLPEFPQEVSAGKLIIASSGTGPECKNDMKIRAYAYAGGIIGVCNPNCPLLIQDCVNQGGLERLDAPSAAGLDQGVDVAAYLRHRNYGTAADALTGELGEKALSASFVGGIVGVNGERHAIVRCQNGGRINGFTALGGVVGLNQGVVYDCALQKNMGSESQDCLGGVVGLNVGPEGVGTAVLEVDGQALTPGTVANCSVDPGLTVTGRRIVGGIAGYNTVGGQLLNNACGANVQGADKVGGIAGENAGGIVLSQPMANGRPQRISAGTGAAGGVIGVNTEDGVLTVQTGVEVVAAGYRGQPATTDKLTVLGGSTAGGIAGINRGTLRAGAEDAAVYLLNRARVQARAGSGAAAGGVAGRQEAAKRTQGLSLGQAVNLGSVQANSGRAGGVVSYVQEGAEVADCRNHGSVTCDGGYAGGIAGENAGTIQDCSVSALPTGEAVITGTGSSERAVGAICAVNRETGYIANSAPGAGVRLAGTATTLGAVAGYNEGEIDGITLLNFPAFSPYSSLTVGGAAGRNRGTVRNVQSYIEMEDLSTIRYLGGVVGLNEAVGRVTGCSFSGMIREARLQSAAGGCYGGVAGLNQGDLTACTLSGFTIAATGVYTATSTSTAEEKERLSTHFGGFAGKNDESGWIEDCLIEAGTAAAGTIAVKNGMAGGVTGYNKGTVRRSGDGSGTAGVTALMGGVTEAGGMDAGDMERLRANCAGLSADADWVAWTSGIEVENLTYNRTQQKVSAGRDLSIIVSQDGNVGGIAGYNAPTGRLDLCVSGNWFIANKSQSLGVGTGGIVGMNEGEAGLSCLVNRAFVARQTAGNQTNRFAGGIVGNQNNSTTTNWTIRGCINYGTVYGYRTHYSGGIVGQWSGNGGAIQDCRNYGNLQTTFAAGWIGASGGIVAQLYHAASGQEFNILSCENHGSIYGQTGESPNNCANDSAGILGNITAFAAAGGNGQRFTINVVDCVNGPGVKIYSASMASGIVGFFSADNPSEAAIGPATQNILLNIDRCRNYASTLSGKTYTSGILGDRYGSAAGTTYIQNCFSAYANVGPIISLSRGNVSTSLELDRVGNNYYFRDFKAGNVADVSGEILESLGTPPIATAQSGELAAEYANAGTRMAGIVRVHTGGGTRYAFALLGEPSPYAGGNGSGGHRELSVKRYIRFSTVNTYLDGKGDLISRGTVSPSFTPVRSGHVLFYVPEAYTRSLDGLKTRGSEFDRYVREYYRQFEACAGDAEKTLQPPQSVTLSFDGGVFTAAITDTNRPLYYEGEVYRNGVLVAQGLRFIPREKEQGPSGNAAVTTGTFTLKGIDSLDGLTLRVRAVSLFEDTRPSAWRESGPIAMEGGVLPTPDVRATLVRNGAGYAYEYSLNNLSEFAAYPGWEVRLTIGGRVLALNGGSPTALLAGQGEQQLTVTASAANYRSPPPRYISTFTPLNGKPGDGRLKNLTWSLSGNSAEDLILTARLEASATSINVPPIYRVELLGTVAGEAEVFASQNVLLSAGSVAGSAVSANFAHIPEAYFAENVADRALRVWYAESGLGPVYTYRLNGQSTVLDNAGDFREYYRKTALDFQVLPAPVLMERDGVLEREERADGSLYYRFCWDEGKNYPDARYKVRLEGILTGGDGTPAAMSIPTGEVYTDSTRREFTISAEDWNYGAVRLTVTRLGDEAAKVVGLSTTQEYQVRRRLERPQQPSADILDNNDLRYQISWPAIDEARNDAGKDPACGGYQVHLRTGDGTAIPLGTVDTDPDKQALIYAAQVDLEDYAGQEVTLYVTALAARDSEGYVDSQSGVEYTFTMPTRLPKPTLEWSWCWVWAEDAAVPAATFSRGLTITAQSTDPDSHPTGDSVLLLEGCIYDSEAEARMGADPIETYTIRAMSGSGETHVYAHTLEDLSIEFAGKYAAFRARTSSGSGKAGSAWTESVIVQLPRVKLARPVTSIGSASEIWQVQVTDVNPDLPITKDWTFQLTTVSWAPVEQAAAYDLTLDGKKVRVTVDSLGRVVKVERMDGETATPVTPNDSGAYVLATAPGQTGTYLNGDRRTSFTYDATTLLTIQDGRFVLTLPNISAIRPDDDCRPEAENGERVKSVSIQAVGPEDRERYDSSDEKTHTF